MSHTVDIDANPIPLVDLLAQHRQVAQEVAAGWARVTSTTSFVLGSDVHEFEQAFAQFSGMAHCVGVGNGTDALELAMRAQGVGPGDEVILPVNSFIASAVAVTRTGATPALVDVTSDTMLLNPDAVEDRIGSRTKAIMPVHLFGQMAPMNELSLLAGRASCLLIEDGAQSHGATQSGWAITPESLVATSFYPGKNLGAYGDGGAVLCSSDITAERLTALRNYGSTKKYHHSEIGFNSRLDTLQAVVLLAKLRHLAEWNDRRRAAAARYDGMLRDVPGVKIPYTRPGNTHVWHLYVIQVADRDSVLAALHAAGIGAGVHYPIPIHAQPAYANLGHRPGEFPVAEAAAGHMISLPLYPEITIAQQERVVAALVAALGNPAVG